MWTFLEKLCMCVCVCVCVCVSDCQWLCVWAHLILQKNISETSVENIRALMGKHLNPEQQEKVPSALMMMKTGHCTELSVDGAFTTGQTAVR